MIKNNIDNFEGLQLLRFFSAFIVMLTHVTFYVQTRINPDMPIWEAGGQGVAIFFVISGLVMGLGSQKFEDNPNGHIRFFILRLIRIVPLYWSLNILKILGMVLVPAQIFVNPDWHNIILSMLFIPSRDMQGEIGAFYSVGWTLNFEMFFYLIFALSLMLKFRPSTLVTLVMTFVVGMSYLREPSWPAYTYLFKDIVLNFIWGMWIAELYKYGVRLNLWLASTLVICGLWIIFNQPEINTFGIQYALFVAGVLFCESKIHGHVPKILIFGGDASYSLYLVHPMVGVFVAIFLSKFGVNSNWFAITLIAFVCLVCSSVTYLYFEKPITSYLKNRYLNKNFNKLK
jgi:peptidoglycan/LPS O-acetylase OafA/YrhL